MDSQHVGFYAFSFFTSLRSSPSGFADKVALVSEFVCQGFECEVSRFKKSLQE